MPNQKRTISYLRVGRDQSNQSISGGTGIPLLENILRQSLRQMRSAASTTLDFKGGKAAVRHRRNNRNGLYLHISTWTERENASTVPHNNARADNADLGTAAPGRSWDYLDGDGMVFISEDHCLILSVGIRREAVEQYLRLLINHAQQISTAVPDGASAFRLIQIIRPDLAQQISDEGIKMLRFPKLGQYWQTAIERDESSMRNNMAYRIAMGLPGLIAKKSSSRKRIEAADNMQAQLVILLSSQKTGLKPEELSEILGEDISEIPNEVEIETRLGTKFKQGKLILTKSVEVPTLDKTVEHQAVWDEMTEYFHDLRNTGALEL